MRTGRCTFCEQVGYRRDECPALQKLEIEERYHRTPDNKIVPGPQGSGNRPIQFRDTEGSRLEQVERQTAAFRKESSIIRRVKSFRIEDDTNEEYTEEDNPAINGLPEYGVSAGRIDRGRGGRPSPTARVLKARVEKEKRLPATKGLRLSTYIADNEIISGAVDYS